MTNLRCRSVAASICLLFAVAVAYAKLPLSSLFISGGKLPQPVEVTEPAILNSSNPWFGTFIPQWNQAPRERVAGPPATAPRYELSFYAASSNEPPRIVYVVYYAWDPSAHRGFLYLPGHLEPWYDTNTGSIIRPHQDGRWNLADPAWCDRINAVIARSQSH